MTRFVLNMIKLFLDITEMVLGMTGFVLNTTGIIIHFTGFKTTNFLIFTELFLVAKLQIVPVLPVQQKKTEQSKNIVIIAKRCPENIPLVVNVSSCFY